MKKERQIGIRVGVPAFFALELEDVYKHKEGAHRALAFPDFLGLLIGMGLEQYRRGKAHAAAPGRKEAPEDIDDEEENLNMMDIPRAALPDLFREFDDAMGQTEPPEAGPRLRLIPAGGLA
jgi:hypothetical protein